MSMQNGTRIGCKDAFHAFLIKNASFDGDLEIPHIQKTLDVPDHLIPFSKALRSTDYSAWVHFYEDDVVFERVWTQPNRYLPVLRRFAGVITPDFSLYRDMPLVMQQWNTYRGKALGHWWQENSLTVVPNVRTADRRSFAFCCDGVERESVIAIGSHGCIRSRIDREYFAEGLAFVVETIHPPKIIVYGTAPDEIFLPYKAQGVEIFQFDSEYSVSRKAVSA